MKKNNELKYEKPVMDIWRLNPSSDIITASQPDMTYGRVNNMSRWSLDF